MKINKISLDIFTLIKNLYMGEYLDINKISNNKFYIKEVGENLKNITKIKILKIEDLIFFVVEIIEDKEKFTFTLMEYIIFNEEKDNLFDLYFDGTEEEAKEIILDDGDEIPIEIQDENLTYFKTASEDPGKEIKKAIKNQKHDDKQF